MDQQLTKIRLAWLVLLRILIGWHFLYEGLIKVLNPSWSAKAYLLDSNGLFAGMFKNIASNPGLLDAVNFLNEWGLVLTGLGLILGVFTRLSSIGGMLLLLLYTFSHPSLLNVTYTMPMEGSYFLIDKNIIELAALGLLFVFPTGRIIGIDRFLIKCLPGDFNKFII